MTSKLKWSILLFIVVALVVLGLLNSAGKFAGTFVDRMVMETSYQKVHADRTAENTYKAELAEIDSLLIGETDPMIIKRLKAKRASLNVLLSSKK